MTFINNWVFLDFDNQSDDFKKSFESKVYLLHMSERPSLLETRGCLAGKGPEAAARSWAYIAKRTAVNSGCLWAGHYMQGDSRLSEMQSFACSQGGRSKVDWRVWRIFSFGSNSTWVTLTDQATPLCSNWHYCCYDTVCRAWKPISSVLALHQEQPCAECQTANQDRSLQPPSGAPLSSLIAFAAAVCSQHLCKYRAHTHHTRFCIRHTRTTQWGSNTNYIP